MTEEKLAQRRLMTYLLERLARDREHVIEAFGASMDFDTVNGILHDYLSDVMCDYGALVQAAQLTEGTGTVQVSDHPTEVLKAHRLSFLHQWDPPDDYSRH